MATTHQPVEQVMSLRLIPELLVFRPADGNETSGAYKAAINADKKSSVFALTRQGLPNLAGSDVDKVGKGAYVMSCGFAPEELELILIGTGSEVSLCEEAAKVLRDQGRKVRVVSMPCMDLFEMQDKEYQESVLPDVSAKRLSVEAGSTMGWQRYVGRDGGCIGVDTYGASAPGPKIMEEYGFTVDNVVAKAKELID